MQCDKLFEQLIEGQDLSNDQMQAVIQDCMTGAWSEVQIASFLALMRMKGETVEELTAAALMMHHYAHTIDLGPDLIDIVGTGGDGKNTFNVSTVSSFVAASAGVKVAKHGNRATSSRSGSADLLISAGFKLNLSDEDFRECMRQCNIAFLFAPHFHQAMQHARSARKQLGIRTLFNLLGPLINPAKVKKQVVGVFSSQWLLPTAQVLANLGSEHALVVHAQDGLDEISISAKTDVVEYTGDEFKNWVIDPKDYDCFHPHLNEIVVDSPEQSLYIAESVFAGDKGPARDIILLNTAAALYCSGYYTSFDTAIEKAIHAIDSGLAGQRFLQLRDLSQTFKESQHD